MISDYRRGTGGRKLAPIIGSAVKGEGGGTLGSDHGK